MPLNKEDKTHDDLTTSMQRLMVLNAKIKENTDMLGEQQSRFNQNSKIVSSFYSNRRQKNKSSLFFLGIGLATILPMVTLAVFLPASIPFLAISLAVFATGLALIPLTYAAMSAVSEIKKPSPKGSSESHAKTGGISRALRGLSTSANTTSDSTSHEPPQSHSEIFAKVDSPNPKLSTPPALSMQ